MLLSKFFLPVLKDTPAEAQVSSHCFMLRSGMIRRNTAGIYSWLPLGLKVLRKIENIVRMNMDAAGFIEVLMPITQSADLWHESGRYETYGKEMLKFQDRHDHELLFGPTNEEVITDIVRNTIQSYKDLPKVLYQIQWKFRDEIRPRFGLMRGREFLMKDAYSFDIDMQGSLKTYDLVFAAYMRTFKDLGLTAIPLSAPTGEIGGNLSHEFHILAETGESTLYYDKKFDLIAEDLTNDLNALKNLYAVTEEKYDSETCPIPQNALAIKKGIEVGHIFNFADKYSTSMNALVNNNEGRLVPIQMGSYGIGISRLAAAIIEVSHDNRGIIWPASVAPFYVSLVNLNIKNEQCVNTANFLYNKLQENNIEVLYDDTEGSPGSKLATHDLIGSPWQIIIGPQKLQHGIVELKYRASGEIEDMNSIQAAEEVIKNINVK